MSLGWVAYGLYLPKLLMQYGFAEGLARNIITLELALGVGLEPLMGALSQQQKKWLGTGLPLWALGMIGATGLFWVIPLLAVLGPTEPTIGWIVAAMMVAWSIAMTVIRSPLLGQLGQYARPDQLPQAASVIALLGMVPAFLGDRLSQALVAMGPGVAFGVSSLVLIISGVGVQWLASKVPGANVLPKTAEQTEPGTELVTELVTEPVTEPGTDLAGEQTDAPEDNPRWLTSGALIFALGLAIAFGSALMRSRLGSFQGAEGGTTPAQLLIWVQTLAMLPAGWVAVRAGNRLMMGIGVGGLAIALLVTGVMGPGLALGLAVLCGLFFSAVQTGSLPLALGFFPQTYGGLAVGLFFGGGNLAGLLVRQLGTPVAASWAIGGGTTAFALAVLGLWFSPSRRQAHRDAKIL